LVAALKAGNLTSALSGKGPFTVFAPTNEAFAKLPADVLKRLLEPQHIKELDAVLEYHVIPGAAVHSADLKPEQKVKTLEGAEILIEKFDKDVYINRIAQVTTADIQASNGVVHIINAVLMPPSKPAPGPTILEIANSDPNLIFFSTLLKSAGLTHTLSGPGPFTVLAPINGAFDTFNVNDLVDPAKSKRLRKILALHVIPGSLSPSNLTAGLVDSLDGDALQVLVRKEGNDWVVGKYIGLPRQDPQDLRNSFKLQGLHDAATYINASNGGVYLVGGVLTPPNTTVPKIPKPSGADAACTKDSCIFEYANRNGCCGYVDASKRMPPSIFNDPVALDEYVRITQQLSVVFRGALGVYTPLTTCRIIPTYVSNGTKTIDWFEGFQPWCQVRCGCGVLKPCKDLPDDPANHVYCSLCGPKYNAPMEVHLYHANNNQVDCSAPHRPRPKTHFLDSLKNWLSDGS